MRCRIMGEMTRRVVVVVWLSILTLLALHLLTRRTTHSDTGHEDNGAMKRTSNTPTSFDERVETEIAEREPAEKEVNLGRVQRYESIESMVTEMLGKVDRDDKRAEFDQVVALSSLLPKITNISRIKTPSPESFRNYIAPMGLPVILTDMFDDSLLRQWNWDYLKKRWGSHVFHNTRQGNYSSQKTSAGKYFVHRVSITLGDFVDVVTGKREPTEMEKGVYITKQKVIPPEALETEFYYPPFYPGPHKTCYLEPTAWIGVPGTFTQGHLDSKDNFAYQIIGRKRWTIFSPTDYDYLYYIEREGSLEWSTALNSLTKPDLKRFPLFAKATPITFTLGEGEMLYLPRGWTHFVENLTPALMINTWRIGPAAITEYWSERNREEIRKKCY